MPAKLPSRNTVKIADMVEFHLDTKLKLPRFDVPSGYTIESYFEKMARDGFAERLKVLMPLAESDFTPDNALQLAA